jgi:hypothetical protein
VLSSSLAHANLGICMRRAIPSPVLKHERQSPMKNLGW